MVDNLNEIVIYCKLNCNKLEPNIEFENKIVQTEIIFYFLQAPVKNSERAY